MCQWRESYNISFHFITRIRKYSHIGNFRHIWNGLIPRQNEDWFPGALSREEKMLWLNRSEISYE